MVVISTFSAPVMAFRVVLANAARVIRKIFGVSPRPNQMMEMGIQAMGGMGRMIRKIGLKIARASR